MQYPGVSKGLDNQLIRHNSDNEIEIDLLAIAQELLGNWKLIFASTLIVTIIGICYRGFLVTPMYASTSMLYVLTKSTSIASLADLQSGENLTQDYLIVSECRPVLEQVIDSLELPETYEELEAKVKVNNPNDTRFLEITVTDPNPERAKAISDEIADVAAAFIAEKMDQDPPNLVQNGYADGETISKSVIVYAVVGAAIGFILASGLVAIEFIFNDTIMLPEDMENLVGIKVLASLPMDS